MVADQDAAGSVCSVVGEETYGAFFCVVVITGVEETRTVVNVIDVKVVACCESVGARHGGCRQNWGRVVSGFRE
jgi:hypothetical protein